MTDKQILALKCAYLDLVGSYEAMEQCDTQAHNWKAHSQSIIDLEQQFNFIREIAE